MTVVRVLALVGPLDSREAQKRLRRLLRRHQGRILGIAVIIQAESPRQAAAIARNYGLTTLSLPPELLVSPRAGERRGG